MALTEPYGHAQTQPSYFLHTVLAVFLPQNPSLCIMNAGLIFRLWFLAMATMLAMSSCQSPSTPNTMLNPTLSDLASALMLDTTEVSASRKTELNALASWTAQSLEEKGSADLIFICTHNSRRSHLSQVWAQTAADMLGLDGVRTYSGGTEATACNPRTVEAMKRAGFEVTTQDTLQGATNPTYLVQAGSTLDGMPCFSKTYGHDVNPQSGFVAVMTCVSADRGCPIVYGADARFAVPYIDPKVSDGTDQEAATYDARLRQIGTEMLYLMGKVKGDVEGLKKAG